MGALRAQTSRERVQGGARGQLTRPEPHWVLQAMPPVLQHRETALSTRCPAVGSGHVSQGRMDLRDELRLVLRSRRRMERAHRPPRLPPSIGHATHLRLPRTKYGARLCYADPLVVPVWSASVCGLRCVGGGVGLTRILPSCLPPPRPAPEPGPDAETIQTPLAHPGQSPRRRLALARIRSSVRACVPEYSH